MASDELALFARLTAAWSRLYVHERRALAVMAGLDADALAAREWQELDDHDRERLLFSFRQAAALGEFAKRLIA